MRSTSNSLITTAPPLQAIQAARVLSRVRVSAAVADVLAGIAFGPDRRDHDVLLAGLVAERVGAAEGVRQ